jgi:hypothetical protein
MLFSIARQQLTRRLSSSFGPAVARHQAAVANGVAYIGGYCFSTPPAANVKNGNKPHYAAASCLLSTRMLSSSAELKESYDYILVERRFPEENGVVGGGVGVISLHRPKALNALCDALFEDLIHAVKAFDKDDDIGCIVITGSGKAFAAGEFKNDEFG